MENTIKETIEVGIDNKSVMIPLKVTMLSNIETPNFNYTLSIDDLGHIVVTPVDTTSEFIQVEFDDEFEERATNLNIISDEGTKKEFNIVLEATMLTEDEYNAFSTVIDDIGQIIVQPNKEETSFITVTTKESLDLVTEAFETMEYCGYILRNVGDGWDVLTKDGEYEEEGIATLNAAKLFVLRLEMKRLNEDVEELETKEAPQVTAEIIEESIESDWVDYAELCNLTDNFKASQGILECDTEEEQEECAKYLSDHYPNVSTITDDSRFFVSYSNILEEEFDDIDVIDKILKGDITIFEGEGTPAETLVPLTKLDTPELSYYYDPESGSVVTYSKEIPNE